MTDLTQEIARVTNRLRVLELKNESDVLMIGELQDQNSALTEELLFIKNAHEKEIEMMRKERDEALSRTAKVQAVLDDTAKRIVSGLLAVKNKTNPRPAYHPPQVDDPRLPRVAPDQLEELPRFLPNLQNQGASRR